MSRWLEGLEAPCDEQIFLQAVEAWGNAMDVPLRGSNEPLLPGRIYLSDIPINRAAMAAMKILRAASVAAPQAYLWRLMHLGEIFCAAQQLGIADLVREDEVHTDVLRAAAIAKLKTPPAAALKTGDDLPAFDLEDVAAKVAGFRQQEARGE